MEYERRTCVDAVVQVTQPNGPLEPPFAIAQLVALIAFVVLTVLAVIRFRPAR